MARSEIIVGLDIGTTKVCTVVGEVSTEERVEILAAGVAPSPGVRKGIIIDIDTTVAAIRESVEKAERAGGVQIGSVYAGIAGEHIASLNSRGVVAVTSVDREIREEHLARVQEAARVIVLPPDREILHSLPRTYIVDGQDGVLHPVGMSAQRLEVDAHVVTGASTFIENVGKCIRRAHLTVEEIVLAPLASSLAVLSEPERALGVALVDIGGGTTDVALVVDGSLYHSASIPVGGKHVTYDLSVGLRIPREQAEALKLQHGCALISRVGEDEYVEIRRIDEEPYELPRRVIPEIIQPRMQEVFDLVGREMERADCDGLSPTGLILTGGGSQLDGVTELAARTLGMPVRLGRLRGVGGLTDAVEGPGYATAVGLVQYGAQRQHPAVRALRNGSLVSSVMERMSRWLLRLSKH